MNFRQCRHKATGFLEEWHRHIHTNARLCFYNEENPNLFPRTHACARMDLNFKLQRWRFMEVLGFQLASEACLNQFSACAVAPGRVDPNSEEHSLWERQVPGSEDKNTNKKNEQKINCERLKNAKDVRLRQRFLDCRCLKVRRCK